MKKIFIIKTGSAFSETAANHGDFEEMVQRGLGRGVLGVETINACQGAALPSPAACLGVVITGSHAMVTEELPWSLEIEAWLPSLVQAQVPLLGICYGHQLLGRAMGGQVDFHPGGKEVGTVEISKTPACSADPLFGSGLPRRFRAHATHAQSVLALPPGAVLLAGNDFEPHHAFRVGSCAWGVQFHPEYNSLIMLDYLHKQADSLAEAGQDVARLLLEVHETPAANTLLARFGSLAREGVSP